MLTISADVKPDPGFMKLAGKYRGRRKRLSDALTADRSDVRPRSKRIGTLI